MILRKPAILLSPYSTLNLFCPPKSSASSSRLSCDTRKRYRNGYATIANDSPRHEDEESHWPAPTKPHSVPTPYQILQHKRNAPYSKHHFYRLVKIYHPDRNSHDHVHSSICHLPEHVRLERYRLIVTAHTILSDPTKRSLYDRFGSGWSGKPEHPLSGFTAERPQWKPGHDPMANATWEDWERWYHRDDEPQSPRFLSNAAFVSVIVMFAALGGIGQATRANHYSADFLEQRNALNDRTHADLMKAKQKAKSATRNERIERFLQQRDPAAYADEGLRKMLLSPDICESSHLQAGKGGYRRQQE